MAYLESKDNGDCSMPTSSGRGSEDAYGIVPQDPRNRVRAKLLPRPIPNRCMPTPIATASTSDVASWSELTFRHSTFRGAR